MASNITFGATNDYPYIFSTGIIVSALSNYTYGLSSLSFGQVYTDENGTANSSYFQDLPNSYPVEFTTNFKGLGLPSAIYNQFVTLFSFVTGYTVVCDATTDGICVLNNACESFPEIANYYFNFTFQNQIPDDLYMLVPLATFAETVGLSGSQKCNLNVNYLNSASSASNHVILGGMFFQEFFGEFQNDYNNPASPDQAVRLYVGQNSIYNSYIGKMDLPLGPDPFVPPAPPAPTPDDNGVSAVWIVVFVVLGCVLLGFMGWAFYSYKLKGIKKNVRGSNVVYADVAKGALVNASGTTEGIGEEERQLLNV